MKALDLRSCEIGTVSSRRDKSVRFSIETAELTAEQSGALMSYHGQAARVFVAPHEGEADELVEVTTDRDTKTPGQRLRACLFVLYKQQTVEPGKELLTFERFYCDEMEKFINHVKAKLPEA